MGGRDPRTRTVCVLHKTPRERGEGQYRSRGFFEKKVIMGLYKIICVKLVKVVKHYRISRIFHSIKKKKVKGLPWWRSG